MRSPRVQAEHPPRRRTREELETKRALWSLQLHASGYRPAQLPSDLHPMPIDRAADIACTAGDDHAAQRRLRILHRFQPDLFLPGSDEGIAPAASAASDEAERVSRRHAWHAECRQRFGIRLPCGSLQPRSSVAAIARIEAHVDLDFHDTDRKQDLAVCVPTADDPNYDPVRGTTSLYSALRTRRSMAFDLAQLLDPRGWDNCSDLFEDTFEVVPDGRGGYRAKPTPPEDYGRSWQGLLYEFADAGPQAVENILWVRFAVTRVCDEEIPHYLLPRGSRARHPAPTSGERVEGPRQRRGRGPEPVAESPSGEGDANFKDYAWRARRYTNLAKGTAQSGGRRGRRGTGGGHHRGDCDCEVDAVEVQYELHDSLSYRVGALSLPGMMRRNSGYLRAWSRADGYTDIQCKKYIHFGRLSRWSVAGAFDFGEMLNYTAAAYLSLWIGEIEQIVPCCTQRKANPTG